MNNLQLKILKYIKSSNGASYADTLTHFQKLGISVSDTSDMIQILTDSEFISSSNKLDIHNSFLSVTRYGNAELFMKYDVVEIEKKNTLRYRITTAIALIALIKSFQPEIMELLSLISGK